ARADAGSLLRGEFRPGGSGREWCDPEVLRQLRQRSLAALRKEVEPVDASALAGFLPAWQGVGSDARGLDRLFEVVRQLQGVAIPASVLERDVLPARVADYSPRLLDELAAAGEVVWVGAGPLGRDDGKVMLFLRGHAPLLRPPPTGVDPSGPEHERLREFLDRRGASFFRELSGIDDRASLDALWDLVWAGEVTNDSFAALRAFAGGAGSRSKAAKRSGRPRLGSLTVLGPPKAQGRWSLVEADLPVGDVTPTQRQHALAASLLDRHGVLTREAVRGEGHPRGFAGVYPVLRAMEESGRCRRGYFVAGLGGAQFALPGAVDRLRADRRDSAKGTLVLAATDPANAYGVSLPWPQRPGAEARPVNGPRRVAGAYVVLLDGFPSLYVEKAAKGLIALRPYDGAWEEVAIAALGALVTSGRLRRLNVERYDDDLEPVLRAAGFVPTPRGLVRYGA
ncbi:MAG: DEAD/DEAH box helicase, partial [Actinomycetota bacterium]|nr:DEAD/DEAH box helicase [Actinomycetota bacterium]